MLYKHTHSRPFDLNAAAALHDGAHVEDLTEVGTAGHKVLGVDRLVGALEDLERGVVRAAEGQTGRGRLEQERVVVLLTWVSQASIERRYAR